jgi:replicative DNA helicase
MCGASPRKLVGVGNEAVACSLPNGSAGTTEQVVARIRQRVFILSWSMPVAEANSGKETVRDTLQNTAEQIAGSLF